jgi:hypothetical protein
MTQAADEEILLGKAEPDEYDLWCSRAEMGGDPIDFLGVILKAQRGTGCTGDPKSRVAVN